MNIFKRIPDGVRKTIYVTVTVVVAVLVAIGIIDKSILENISTTVDVLAGLIITLTTLMASQNVTPQTPPVPPADVTEPPTECYEAFTEE